MVGKVHKSHWVRFELNSVFDYEKVDQWNPIRTSAIQSRSRLMGFSNHEKGAPRILLKSAANGLKYVFENWMEHCKKCIACQGRYLERDRHRTSTKFRLGIIG
jgi:hypothetical protein